LIYIFPKGVVDSAEGLIIPTMEREKGKVDPDKDHIGDIVFWVKIKGPIVEIHRIGTHEVRPTPEYQISILLFLKHKCTKTSTTKGEGYLTF
jgi:hypothetical protein